MDNNTFGCVTVAVDSCSSNSKRCFTVSAIGLMYKDVKNVTFKSKVLYNRDSTLRYIKDLDNTSLYISQLKNKSSN